MWLVTHRGSHAAKRDPDAIMRGGLPLLILLAMVVGGATLMVLTRG